jgi:hypothetical protein
MKYSKFLSSCAMRSDITVFTAVSGTCPEATEYGPYPSNLLQNSFQSHFPINTQQSFPDVFSHYSSAHTSSLTCMLHALVFIQFKNSAL